MNLSKVLLPVALLAFPTSFGLNVTDTSVYFGTVDNAPYHDWTNRHGGRYDRSVFLQPGTDPANGAAIHWSVNSTHFWMSLAVRAVGWAGFGIAENGGMRGADMFLYEAATNQVTDAYVLDNLQPLIDDCNDWEVVNMTSEGGFIIVEVSRKLDTGDSQDRSISNDSDLSISPHRIIAAWGDSGNVMHHGASNRVRGSVRFFDDQSRTEPQRFQKAMEDEAEGYFDLLASNHAIRATETEYALFCFTLQDLIDLGVPMMSELHTIGIEPIVENHKYVHHYIIYATESGDATCNTEDDFGQMAFAWAPGEGPVHLPPNVGQPLGAGGGFKGFLVEIHYNNPALNSGVMDSSGVRFHYTSKKREFDLGIWQVGDPNVNLFGEPVGDGLSSHTFDCPGTCSLVLFPSKVTVLREYLHMHGSGVKMSNSQIRNGAEIRRSEVGFFDFDQSGSFTPIQEPYEFRPGDGYETECIFNSQDDRVFGLSSSEEMCIAFMFYYPRVTFQGYNPICGFGFGFFPQCDSPHQVRSLLGSSELERKFGGKSEICGGSVDMPSTSPSLEGTITEGPASSPTLSVDMPSTSPSLEESSLEPTPSPTSSGACLSGFAAALLLLVIAISLILLHEI